MAAVMTNNARQKCHIPSGLITLVMINLARFLKLQLMPLGMILKINLVTVLRLSRSKLMKEWMLPLVTKVINIVGAKNKKAHPEASKVHPKATLKDNAKFHSILILLHLQFEMLHGLSHLVGEFYLLIVAWKGKQLFPVLWKAIITLTHGILVLTLSWILLQVTHVVFLVTIR